MRSVFDKIDQELTTLIEALSSESLELDTINEVVPGVREGVLAAIHSSAPVDDLQHHQYDHLVHEWLPKFKEFLAYLRNVAFRIYRDEQLRQDGITAEVSKEEIDHQSEAILNDAKKELDRDLSKIIHMPIVDQELASVWKHYDDPLNVLSTQTSSIVEQVSALPSNRELLDAVRVQINDTRSQVIDRLEHSHQAVRTVEDNLNAVIAKLESLPTHWKQQQLQSQSNELERLRESVEATKASLEVVDVQFDLPGSKTVPIAVRGLQLMVKQLNFNQQVRVWFSQDVYPKLVRIHEENLRLLDLTIVTTFNIRNGIQVFLIDIEQNETSDATTIVQQLQELGEDFHKGMAVLRGMIEEVTQMLHVHLVVSNVFDTTHEFLDVPLISINQYRRDGTAWLAQSRLRKLWKKAGILWTNKIRPGFKSSFELAHVIDFVDARSLEEDETHSQALFLKKGFIGQSFNIRREDYIQQLRRAFLSWEKGFRGSMLVYGYRLSGRSSIVESVRHMDWINHPVIYLEPNCTVEVRSRKYECGTDLDAALNFINKHHVVDKVCVVIDDLESWRGDKDSFFANVKSLIADVNRYSKNMYFIVVTNHWMKNHLDLYFNFSSQFVDNYCTDRMQIKDIASAILIRESALRAQVSSTEWQEAREGQKKRATKVAGESRQNIGSSLRSWSRQLLPSDEVTTHSQALKRIVDDYWTILSHLMKYKTTNEVELSRVVGNNQMKVINQRLQFLLGCKILVRTRDDKLCLNDDIVDVLENQMMTNSHRKLHAAH